MKQRENDLNFQCRFVFTALANCTRFNKFLCLILLRVHEVVNCPATCFLCIDTKGLSRLTSPRHVPQCVLNFKNCWWFGTTLITNGLTSYLNIVQTLLTSRNCYSELLSDCHATYPLEQLINICWFAFILVCVCICDISYSVESGQSRETF